MKTLLIGLCFLLTLTVHAAQPTFKDLVWSNTGTFVAQKSFPTNLQSRNIDGSLYVGTLAGNLDFGNGNVRSDTESYYPLVLIQGTNRIAMDGSFYWRSGFGLSPDPSASAWSLVAASGVWNPANESYTTVLDVQSQGQLDNSSAKLTVLNFAGNNASSLTLTPAGGGKVITLSSDAAAGASFTIGSIFKVDNSGSVTLASTATITNAAGPALYFGATNSPTFAAANGSVYLGGGGGFYVRTNATWFAVKLN